MSVANSARNGWVFGGVEMHTDELRKAKPHLDKGEAVRVRAAMGGVARYARVFHGKDGHERTPTGGVVLSF